MVKNPIRILIVEDDPVSRRLSEGMLAGADWGAFECCTADSLEAALGVLAAERFDAVLLDLNLPDSSQLDTLKSVIQKHSDTAVVVVTGAYDKELGLEAIDIGAGEFLVKGKFDAELLVKSILYSIERKRLNARLAESEERHRMLIENAEIAVCYFDLKGNIVFMNGKAAGLFGWETEDVSGRSIYDMYPKDEADRHMARYSKMISEEAGGRFEDQLDLASGKVWHMSDIRPVKNAAGKIIGLQVISSDITARKRLEEELLEKTYQLGERVKKLKCLYGMSRFLETPGILLDDIFKKTAEIIPAAWQYPDITCAKVVFEDSEYKTENFKETSWKQVSDIVVHGEVKGSVRVYYLEEKPLFYEGPFLKEERELLNVLSERLSKVAERISAEKKLRESESMLKEHRVAMEQKNIDLMDILSQVESKAKVVEENVKANIVQVAMPIVEKIKLTGKHQKQCELLEDSLKSLTGSFGSQISDIRNKLSPREVEICNMVRSGVMNKEISRLLGISLYTVERHRRNIRSKLGVSNRDVNLTTYLQSF